MKDALELAGKLGIGGGIGFLLGWLVVWWVEPTTKGGTGLLIVISIVFCATIAAIVSKFVGSKIEKEQKDKKEQPKVSAPELSNKVAQPLDQWQC